MRKRGSDLLVCTDPGIIVHVWQGSLNIRSRESLNCFKPRSGLRTVIFAGHGGTVSTGAIRWCAREAVSLYVMERSGEYFSVIGEAAEANSQRRALTVRARQWKAFLDPAKRLAVANRIVGEKLRTLDLHPADARGFRQELAQARKLDDILTAEARAGAAFFMQFRGAELRFRHQAPITFTARSGSLIKGKGGTSKARHAATPWGATLNYAYAAGLGQCIRACAGLGLDPAIGFLHSPKPGRSSMAYDALELIRADLTRAVFAYGTGRIFNRDDFELTDKGVVRLAPETARETAQLALRVATAAECVKIIRRISSWL